MDRPPRYSSVFVARDTASTVLWRTVTNHHRAFIVFFARDGIIRTVPSHRVIVRSFLNGSWQARYRMNGNKRPRYLTVCYCARRGKHGIIWTRISYRGSLRYCLHGTRQSLMRRPRQKRKTAQFPLFIVRSVRCSPTRTSP